MYLAPPDMSWDDTAIWGTNISLHILLNSLLPHHCLAPYILHCQ
jgi:hypothetical protein